MAEQTIQLLSWFQPAYLKVVGNAVYNGVTSSHKCGSEWCVIQGFLRTFQS